MKSTFGQPNRHAAARTHVLKSGARCTPSFSSRAAGWSETGAGELLHLDRRSQRVTTTCPTSVVTSGPSTPPARPRSRPAFSERLTQGLARGATPAAATVAVDDLDHPWPTARSQITRRFAAMAAAISSQFDSVGATPRAVAILGQLHPASWAARSDSASVLSAATVVRQATLNSANGSRFHLPILRSRTRSPRPRRRSAGAPVMTSPFSLHECSESQRKTGYSHLTVVPCLVNGFTPRVGRRW